MTICKIYPCYNFAQWDLQVNWWNARYKREIFRGYRYELIWD